MNYGKYKPVKLLPFDLYNIEDFIGAISWYNYHPVREEDKYREYWEQEATYSILGKWGNDSKTVKGKRVGGYRWIPGNMYFSTNYLPIEKDDPDNPTGRQILTNADFRDVDLLINYDLAVSAGFAGFSGDDRYSGFYPLKLYEENNGKLPSHAMRILMERHKHHLVDKYGKLKKYKDPFEILYATYYDPIGDPLWLNELSDYMILSTRRLGKSYNILNGVACYDFVFGGAKSPDDYFNWGTSSTTIVGSGKSEKTKEFFDKWLKSYDWLRTKVGAYTEKDGSLIEGCFWLPTQGGIRKENDVLTNSVLARGGQGLVGPGSKMIHLSFLTDASKAAGFAPTTLIAEEQGLIKDPVRVHSESAPGMERDYKFGRYIGIGTGGDFEKVEGSKKMYYNPENYKILKIKCPFTGKYKARFIPVYYYKNQYRDENGNQDYKAAFEDHMLDRQREERGDPEKYLQFKSSYPIIDSEIFMIVKGNYFPVADLEKRKLALETTPLNISMGKLEWTDRQNTIPIWNEDLDAVYIDNIDDMMKAKGTKAAVGTIAIYEHPKKYKPKPTIDNPMYILFADLVRNDTGSSFVYAWIEKQYDFGDSSAIQQGCVAEWFGRFDRTEDNHNQIFKMAMYYNALIFPEINNGDIKGYARLRNRYNMLHPCLNNSDGLEIAIDDSHEVGLYVGPTMRGPMENMLREKLLAKVDTKEYLSGKEYRREEIKYVDTITSVLQINCLLEYSRDKNNDVADGMMVGAVWNKSIEKAEPQHFDSESDKKLKAVLKSWQQRNSVKKRYSIA